MSTTYKRQKDNNKQTKNMNNKILIGMSGGIDSAVAAYLLQQKGYSVTGTTLRLWNVGETRCCEIGKAQNTAKRLDILYQPHNMFPAFRQYVVKPFVAEYAVGRTPNPCIICNRHVKWAGLIELADTLGADYIATGHYAAVVKLANGRFTVRRAKDEKKDQSYMLCKLSQDQLARTVLPLAALTKQQVRQLAAQAQIADGNSPESQEICFVTDGNYADYVERECSDSGCTKAGNFVDDAGNILGTHNGIIHYTVGQRKGLSLALGYPVYVKTIRPATNEIVIGTDSSLYEWKIFCDELNFMSVPDIAVGKKMPAKVSIRYHHNGENAIVTRINSAVVSVSFVEKPVRAPAPGQAAVFYDDDDSIIGSGRIIRSNHEHNNN